MSHVDVPELLAAIGRARRTPTTPPREREPHVRGESVFADDPAVREVLDVAVIVLRGFFEPDAESRRARAAALAPSHHDFGAAFERDAADLARVGYAGLWAREPVIGPAPGQSQLSISAAWSHQLRARSPSARRFPAGYLRAAPHLRPGRLWLTWRYAGGEGPDTAHDGLVWLERGWTWFPAPWTVLQPLLAEP